MDVIYVRSAMARKINSDTNCIVTLLNSLTARVHVMILACVIGDLVAVRCIDVEPFHTTEFYVALKSVRVKSFTSTVLILFWCSGSVTRAINTFEVRFVVESPWYTEKIIVLK